MLQAWKEKIRGGNVRGYHEAISNLILKMVNGSNLHTLEHVKHNNKYFIKASQSLLLFIQNI